MHTKNKIRLPWGGLPSRPPRGSDLYRLLSHTYPRNGGILALRAGGGDDVVAAAW